ncbi:MAG: VWA domain-containing protein, partial [Candidatus Thermoplasmatota archaeon]
EIYVPARRFYPNGWRVDEAPSLRLLALASDQRQMADIGTTVTFPLVATNLQMTAEYVNVAYATVTTWPVVLRWTNGTPLSDSLGDPDAIPDIGSVGPGASVPFLAEVSVPIEGQIGHGNLVNVTVIAASLPVGRDSVTLAVDLYPHFDVTRAVDPSPVYVEGSGPPWNENSQITIAVTGAGLPMVQLIPIDVVWQIDTSGSMASSDPLNLRVDAVNYFIDNMRVDDRGAVVGFNDNAWVVSNRPLTYTDAMGKQTLKDDANTTRFAGGGTNIDAAIQVANDLLIAQGNRSRPRIEILLTDGVCTVPFPPCQNTNNLINQAIAEGIVIYTIGLGSAVDQAFLDNIATRTGGRYYHADRPEDLQPIYEEIGLRINRTAGIDPDVTDSVPMIEEHLAAYLHVVPGSFYDPVTGFPRIPSFLQQFGDRTRIQWNVARIDINETWSVRFSVTSVRLGVQDVALHPDARVSYVRWDGSTVFQPIPQGTLEVLRPPSPPYITATVPAHGTVDVPLNQPIYAMFSEAMDGATVAWTIAPPIPLVPTWINAYTLELAHAGLSECVRYTVNVTQGRDAQGEDLVPGPFPNPWSFNTVCPLRVRYTITRSPVVGDVFVDGIAYPVPATFVWLANGTHDIEAPDFDPIGGSRLAFLAWDDGGARDHVIAVGMTDATITAGYAL